ncbi:MFS transporter [Bacillaceae bacterium SIJ1]|uniref:MFS transporter n=1 Tax=Litoribacterium kuwaitense TaxID=1398745 RepID=UPI0013EB8791|nr:MFS transporter [Litoribacterium kuwaitense]NGP46793.1 MFS transporter [Litoribacterium kuwaitense]
MQKRTSLRLDMCLFFMMSLLFFMSISAFDPFISAFATDIGIAPAVVGGIVGVAGLASLITRLPVGVLSDMFLKRKLFIQIGLLVTIICWTIAFIAPSATTLYIGKISDGITGSTWVIYNVMFASFFGAREAAKAVAILGVASPFGSLIGSTVGGLIATSYGYEYSFMVAVVAACIALILSFFVKERKESEIKTKYDMTILTEQISDKTIWIIGVLATISIMIPFGTRDTFTPLVAVDLGANPFAISWLSNTHLIFYGLAAALCAPFFYKKLGLVRTAIWGALLQGLIVILIPYAPNLLALFTLQGLAGIAFGMNFTVLTSLSIHHIPAQKQSTRMGLFQSIYAAGMFAGPVLMGILTDSFSRTTSFLVIGIVSVLCAVLTGFLLKKGQHVVSEEKIDSPVEYDPSISK